MTTTEVKSKLIENSVFGQQPSNWAVDRIRDKLASIVGGEWGDDPDAHDEGVLVPVIRVADIRGIDLKTQDLTIRRIKESKLAGRLINERSVLLEKSGGGELKPVGRAVRCRAISFDAICSNFMAKIDCGPSLDPSFLVYLFDALYLCGVNGACIQQTTGIQNLRLRDYLDTKVGFPSVTEQIRIAAFLDEQCTHLAKVVSAASMIDDGVSQIGALNKQMQTLFAYQKSLIFECVTGQRRITDADIKRAKTNG